MLYTIALGGNALLQRGEPLEANLLKKNALIAAKLIAELAKEHQVVVVHGNGPQVGLLALQSAAYTEVAPYPFDILGAESQGMIGYVLQQGIGNHLPSKTVTTLLTQVIVDKNDPAFQNPSKFIGSVYHAEQVGLVQQTNPNWVLKADGNYFRRVVPSPTPLAIREIDAIKSLLSHEAVVIAGGGGGVPCLKDATGELSGLEAVIDKDMTASLLAQQLNADHFIILTDIDGVYENFGSEQQRLLRQLDLNTAKSESYAAGSMGPKVKACVQFAERTGRQASIGRLDQLIQITSHRTGTLIYQ